MRVLRSFDVNRPGASADDIVGGVLGGAIIRGTIRIGDLIDIGPGIPQQTKTGTQWNPITANVKSLHSRQEQTAEAGRGGLVAVGTDLDPSLTRSNNLAGSVLSHAGGLPTILNAAVVETHLFEDAVGVEKLAPGELVVLNVGTAVTPAKIVSMRGEHVNFAFERGVCAEVGDRIAISRRIAGNWRLAGFGLIA